MATILVLLYILAVLAPTFLIVAWVAYQRLGWKGLLAAWALTVPLVGGMCTYKLSGWAYGAPDAAIRTVYYAFVATAALGLPLAIGAAVVARGPTMRLTSAAIRSQVGAIARLLAGAWLATLAAAPLAAGLVMVVDVVYASIRS
jgi:hypothetical protein